MSNPNIPQDVPARRPITKIEVAGKCLKGGTVVECKAVQLPSSSDGRG